MNTERYLEVFRQSLQHDSYFRSSLEDWFDGPVDALLLSENSDYLRDLGMRFISMLSDSGVDVVVGDHRVRALGTLPAEHVTLESFEDTSVQTQVDDPTGPDSSDLLHDVVTSMSDFTNLILDSKLGDLDQFSTDLYTLLRSINELVSRIQMKLVMSPHDHT